MKTYNVIIAGNHEFTVKANNTKEAKKIAVMNKRKMGIKGDIKLIRN